MNDMNPGARYEMNKVKGKGSYGLVAAYKDNEKNKKVAIKRMHKVEDMIDAKRMLREIRILNEFKHENIINQERVIFVENPTLQFGEVYLVSNQMDVDLNTLIKKSKDELTDDHIQYIMYQIFRAMKYVHSAEVIHRDIKPSNILANESCDIRICDFGFARGEAEDLTEYVVTRFYRAPEVMLSNQKYSTAVDIWSIGCSFFELITGKPQFQAKNYLELVKMMIQVLGKPSPESLKFITNEHALSYITKLQDFPKKKATQGVSYCNDKALDLINKCLEFNPSERISADDALKHPYFEGLHDPDDEPEFKGKIDNSFEGDSKIEVNDIRIQILEEINKVNARNNEPKYDLDPIKKRLNAQK